MAKKILDPIEVDGSVTAINFIGSGAGLTNVAQTATLDGFSSTSGGAVTATDTVQTALQKIEYKVNTGSGGTGSDANYVFNQILPAAVWTINHGLNKFPSVTVVDSADTKVEGDISFTSVNQVVITFTGAFAGRAFLN